jgi:hypothetical protein
VKLGESLKGIFIGKILLIWGLKRSKKSEGQFSLNYLKNDINQTCFITFNFAFNFYFFTKISEKFNIIQKIPENISPTQKPFKIFNLI